MTERSSNLEQYAFPPYLSILTNEGWWEIDTRVGFFQARHQRGEWRAMGAVTYKVGEPLMITWSDGQFSCLGVVVEVIPCLRH